MTAHLWYSLHWLLTIMALVIAWRSGGIPERQATLILAIGHLISAPISFFSAAAVVAVDLMITLAFLGLSVAYRRWWLIIAAGACLLIMAVHMSVALDRDIFKRAYTTYRFMPGVLLLAAIGFSPLERWLSSEPRLSCWAIWRGPRGST